MGPLQNLLSLVRASLRRLANHLNGYLTHPLLGIAEDLPVGALGEVSNCRKHSLLMGHPGVRMRIYRAPSSNHHGIRNINRLGEEVGKGVDVGELEGESAPRVC